MRILVLGGNGLIGSAVVRRLKAGGHDVVALGRDVAGPSRRAPGVAWIAADLRKLTDDAAWRPVLGQAGVAAIVNCAGVLQDGLLDDLAAVQSAAMLALYRVAPACGVAQFVQVSASRSAIDASTLFMRTKGEADRALAASALDWVILRPGLVLSPQAYGGTALLRALASVPLVQPTALAERPVQTVYVDDVADAVLACIEKRVASKTTYDLVEDDPHSLASVVQHLRAWLGLPAAREVAVPEAAIAGLARVGDALGWLGWRAPLRSTTIAELSAGVKGDPTQWRAQTGRPLMSLAQSLGAMPSTVQEHWFARSFLVKPLAIATLALFWCATGLIAFARQDEAARVLVDHGFRYATGLAVVQLGAGLDVLIGLAFLYRPALPRAALAAVLATLAYLAGGTFIAPDLWLDPLGPLLKTLPALVLALTVWAISEDR